MSNASRKLMQVQATAAPPADTGDPHWKYVSLLLDGDGTSDDDNNTFTDSSTNGFTVTENGSVVQGSFSPYGDNWSNSFDGDSDALTIPDSTDFDFGTGDFTMEAWIYPRSLNDTYDYNSIASAHDPNAASAGDTWIFTVLNNQKLTVYGSGGTTSSSNATVSLNEWSHVMITRSSGTIRFFINGTLDTNTPSVTGNFNCPSNGLAIGRQGTPNGSVYRYWDGWISNLRLVKGTALQTSSFTPSTSPLTAVTNTVLLACQSNRFIDNSSSSHTLTPTGTVAVTPFSPFKDSDARTLTADGGSAYFESSSDYLSISDNSAFDFGSGDFTIECWVNTSSFASAYNVLISQWGSSSFAWIFRITSSLVGLYANIGGTQTYTASVTNNLNEWNHFAVAREGSSLRFFKDGTLLGTSSISGTIANATSNVTVGILSDLNSTTAHDGYINDLRVVKGTAVYTSSFTPPTAPLTAVTNTELLLNFQDAGIYDRAGINNLDTVGDARLGFAPIYGTGSLAFDGTGDYLGIKNTPELRFTSSSPFTIELWVNANVLSGDQHFFWAYDPSSPYTGWALAFGANSQAATTLTWWDGTSWTNIKTGMETNRWYHIAVCSEGSASTGRFFVDGVQQGSAYTIPSTILNTTTNIRLGGQNNALYFNGYFDDVRITNGVARYTSDFTPPTEIDLSTDTHREYVTLFLDGDGTVNGQNNTFTDGSTNGATITETGSVVQGVFSPYGDNWANYFNDDGYLQVTKSTDLDLDTNNWTIECWLNLKSASAVEVVLNFGYETGTTRGYLIYLNSGALHFAYSTNGSNNTDTSMGSHGIVANEWTHLAVVRNGSTITGYINGSALGTTINIGSSDIYYPTSGNFRIGSDATNHLAGYMSNMRLVNGTAVYTSNFTPSTSPLTAITNTKLLTSQSNRFQDNSTSSHAISVAAGTPKVTRFSPFESNKPYDITTDGGSGFVNSTGNYLSLTHSADLKPGASGAFSIELWYYPTSSGTTRQIIGDFKVISYPSNCNGFDILEHSDKTARIRWGYPTYADGGSGASEKLETNQWNHVVFCRDAEATPTMSLFVNGVRTYTTTSNTGITDSTLSNFYLGWAGSQSGTTIPPALGNICDVRMLKGLTAYDPTQATLTVPTSPLTAVTNTELLANFQDSAIPDLSGLNNIDTIGNAKVDGTDPTKYGSNAMQFDGSGDYLELQANQEVFNLGTGDFTVECWFYANALSATTYSTLFGFHNGGSSEWGSYARSNGVFIYGSANTLTGAGTVSTSTWHHYAATRSGSTVRVFLNGTQVATDTVSGSYTSSAIPFRVGIDGGINDYFNGYIDDLRITKGYARYTSNFTAPSAALKKF
jgi:hypothetical protein